MDTSKSGDYPYSIRCLKAIESFIGGRKALADCLSCSPHAITRWVNERQIAKNAILDLVRLSESKFSAEELLGKFDGTGN